MAKRKHWLAHLNISAEELAQFRATAQRREVARHQERVKRQKRAWEVARQAATMLRKTFGATRVVVFGSLVHPEWTFGERSDIDLAAWNVQDYFLAGARLQDLDPNFNIDLIAMPHCHPRLRKHIEREGVDI